MENTKQKTLATYALIGFILIFSLFSTCNSKSAKKYGKSNELKIDSLTEIVTLINNNTQKLEKTIKIEGLKTEKSTLLNTNQIFLTNKRPDERVMEIDKEIEVLENK